MTCNNNEECSMKESNNCLCESTSNFIKKIPNIYRWLLAVIDELINSTKRVIIWLMPFLLGYFYIAYIYNTIEYPLDYVLKTDITSISSTIFSTFFAGTLAYYGVMYTLTYRVKVEVLSKNRQEWINSLRSELSEYITNYTLILNNIYNSPTVSNLRETETKMSKNYNAIYLFLNKNEQTGSTLISIMMALNRNINRLGYILELIEHIKTIDPQITDTKIISILMLFSQEYDSVKREKVMNLLSKYDDRISKTTLRIYRTVLNRYEKEITQEYDLLSKVDKLLSSYKSYNIKELGLVKDRQNPLYYRQHRAFQNLATICLKEEWKRVKKTR